jgi:hypothetical protein
LPAEVRNQERSCGIPPNGTKVQSTLEKPTL